MEPAPKDTLLRIRGVRWQGIQETWFLIPILSDGVSHLTSLPLSFCKHLFLISFAERWEDQTRVVLLGFELHKCKDTGGVLNRDQREAPWHEGHVEVTRDSEQCQSGVLAITHESELQVLH